jgi:hypothetical protein
MKIFNLRTCGSTLFRNSIVALLGLVFILPGGVHATRDEAMFAARVLVVVLEAAGYEFMSTGTGFLQQGGVAVHKVILAANESYAVVAGGCGDAYDVDVEIYDENQRLISRDDTTESFASAEVTPRWTGAFYLRVTMFHSTLDGAHYVLLLGRLRITSSAPQKRSSGPNRKDRY